MHKHKHGKPNWNHFLQWVIIALILCVVMSHFNLWAFWWVPFLFICFSRCGRHSHSRHESKRKYVDDDDIDYV